MQSLKIFVLSNMQDITNEELHPLSIEYLHKVKVSYRKKHGQYFTPKKIRNQLLSLLPQIKSPEILDPACGSGEFLLSASEKWPDSTLHGWEIDPNLVKLARKISPKAKISQMNSLKSKTNIKYDIIIGNPPYFEMKLSEQQKIKYCEILGGRMNIFSLFIKLSIDILKDNGCLGFVIPPSMNNGAYFSKLRDFILKNTEIQHLKLISSSSIFTNAQQKVMILILKKQKNTQKYVFSKNSIDIFSPNRNKLNQAFKHKTTLFESGFTVKTGTIVWNKEKNNLTNSASKGKLLIWAHNIKNQKLTLHNNLKPQYIISKKIDSGPVILVNRITGNSSKAKLRAVVIPKSTQFLAENHVNIIYPPSKLNGKNVSIALLKSIANQISSTEIATIIRLISGNTQFSKTELLKLLPLNIIH